MKLFIAFLVCLFLFSCQSQRQNNQDLAEVQKQIAQLSEENQKLHQEISLLREELEKERMAMAEARVRQQQSEEKRTGQGMTTERVKADLAPLMKEALAKARASMETPAKGKRYGMRVEFDLKRAVYGLVRTDDPEMPFRAKVIVKYERFLYSDENSKSYGDGASLFEFAYKNDRWVPIPPP